MGVPPPPTRYQDVVFVPKPGQFDFSFKPKFSYPTITPANVANIPIPRLVFNPVCPAGTKSFGPIVTHDSMCTSPCPNGFTDMGMMCNKTSFPPQFITKQLVPPISQTTAITPLVGSSNTPANATPKQQTAYASYRDLNTSLGKIQTDFEAASKHFNEQVTKYQNLKADLERLFKLAVDAVTGAGSVGMPPLVPGGEEKARNALDTYNSAVRTIEILSGRVNQAQRTPANDKLAKDSLVNLRNTVGNIFNAREDVIRKLNIAVAAIATANTEAAEQAARNAKTKADAEAARVAKQLADAQAALAASASAAVASGAAAARTASAARAANNAGRAARAANNAGRAASAAAAAQVVQVAEKKPIDNKTIVKQSSNPNSSGKCPNDTMLVNGKCWTKCPQGYIDTGLACQQMTQGGLQVQTVLEPVKNAPRKVANVVRENIEKLRTNAAMLGGYRKKGRSTRGAKKGGKLRKKQNSGKNTYRRKF
jgi:hypothetical protein